MAKKKVLFLVRRYPETIRAGFISPEICKSGFIVCNDEIENR
jgi:hypothetical protein